MVEYFSQLDFQREWYVKGTQVKVNRLDNFPGQRQKTMSEEKAYEVVETKLYSNHSGFVILIKDDNDKLSSYDPAYFRFADDHLNELVMLLYG